MIPDELKDWDEIIGGASGNEHARNQAQLKAVKKLVLSIANLQQHILSLQKVLGTRLDKTIQITEENNRISTKLYKIYIWLTFVIAFSAVASLIISLLAFFKK